MFLFCSLWKIYILARVPTKRKYFLAASALFLLEVFIAIYVRDAFVRPYLGDVLVVIFLYCLLRAFLKISPVAAVVAVFLFAFTVEVLQYFNAVSFLGLANNKIATVVLGSHSEWRDILCYVVGAAIVLLFEASVNPTGQWKKS